MARAYSQDLRERVIKTALGGVSVRQAAARYGVGVSTAILWVRRARSGEVTARRQGQPTGSKLDPHATYLLELIEASSHVSLHEMQVKLTEERGISAGIGTLWRFFHKPALTSFGDSWQDAVIYAESHDEVGNTDDRIARRGRDGKGWEMGQIAAAASILARGIPMLFMGQEAGERMQFGQDDGKLPVHQPGAHDPGTGATWWDDHLPLDSYEQDPGKRKVGLWYERILRIRRGDLNRFAAGDIVLTHLHDDNGIAAFTRDGGKYLVVLNFKGRSWDRYDVGVCGRYEELANTSWPAFNLGGYPEKTRRGGAAHDIDDVPIPAYGAVVLVRWD